MISLEKLCIDLIVQKFDQFYCAFTVSKNDNLKRNFEFLQRKFSAELTEALYTTKKLKKEYFKLLINEHLNHFDQKWIVNVGFWSHKKDIFLRLPNLKSVDFSYYCNDEILEYFAKCCPKISEIGLGGSYVTDKGVEYLCKDKNGAVPCPKLKKINIWGSKVTDKGAKCLIRNLPYLEFIHCENLPLIVHSLYEENLLEFKTVKSYNLIKLHLLGDKFRDLPNYSHILKTCISVCPKLKEFSCYISDKGQLTWLRNLHHLKELCLVSLSIGPEINIDSFIKQKVYNITSLSISSCSMSISALGMHFPVLRELYACSVRFPDEADDVELNFPCLSECSFVAIECSSQKAIGLLLSSSPNLQCLKVSSIAFSPELKSKILHWGKNDCAKTIRIFYIHLASEKKFLEDIITNCTFLEKFYVIGDSTTDTVEMILNLRKLAESLPNKPEIN